MRLFLASLFVGLALMVGGATASQAQVGIGVEVGGPPPVCEYGYYDYAPYECAPDGYYGSGYFYNGIFLGVGPWYHWGYGHGWGSYRFHGAGYGRHGYGYRGHAVTHQGYRGSYHGNGHGTGGHSSSSHNHR
jgi:hypothetical protein